jgi:hypothetical protein
MVSRVLREAKRDAEVVAAEPALIDACPLADKRDSIRINVIAARLDRASNVPAERPRLLDAAEADQHLLTQDAGVEGARVRLETALLRDDAQAALAAWKDYFWLDETDSPQALEHFGATRLFVRGLAAKATAADTLALADLLMRAGFAQASRRYAESHGLPGKATASPVWRRLNTYWHERDRLEAEVLRVNRELARGHKDEEALEVAAKSAMANLMNAAGASGDPRQALREHYGLVGTVGKTSGYPSIHLGHLVEDRVD